MENLAITGGARDPDGQATDAAIVVKNSRVVIRHNRIYDNIGDSTLVVKNIVGIMGIAGRENAELTIANNEIIRNSWDGIALYRGARATITGNLVDGVDRAGGGTAGGGRGVGIGVTWNAQATIEQNRVTRYWKGIGIFVDAGVVARANIIEDVLTWGIAYWDADSGAPVGIIENNAIYQTGACGASIARSKPGENTGRFAGNVIIRAAQNPKYDSPEYYCAQCALAVSARPANFLIAHNLFYDNRRATPDLPDFDSSRDAFAARADSLYHVFARIQRFRDSAFARYLQAFITK